MLAATLLLLSACNSATTTTTDSSSSSSGATDFLSASLCAPGTYTSSTMNYAQTFTLTSQTVTTSTTDFTTVTFNIPDDALSVGIVARSPNSPLVVFEHGLFFNTSPPDCLTTPNGSAPLAFNKIDIDADPEEDLDLSLLLDSGTVSLMYPNDGSVITLPAGPYTFPIATADQNGVFTAASVDVDFFYKTSTDNTDNIESILNVNLFVVPGVGANILMPEGLSTQTEVAASAILTEAANVLGTLLGDLGAAGAGLSVNVVKRLLPDTLAGVAVENFQIIETETELDTLFGSYPPPGEDDAVNIFIVANMIVFGSGVIGLTSRIPGPFNIDGTNRSGVVVEYSENSSGTLLGFVLAHEVGHYLGLYHSSQTNGFGSAISIIGHDPIADTAECTTAILQVRNLLNDCPDSNNLMFPFLLNSDPSAANLTAEQIIVLRLNPATTP